MQHPARLLLAASTLIAFLLFITLLTRWLMPMGTLESATVTATPTSTAIPTATSTHPPTWTPTATSSPTATPTPTSTPAPPSPPNVAHTFDISETVTPQFLPQPTPLPPVEQPEGVVNILLLGTDASERLTDVIIIVSINPDIPAVSMLSIPRDFYAWVPGHGFEKLNTVYSRGLRNAEGGVGLLEETIEYNFGIPIHYYAMVNFSGFITVVDTVGGIDVPVECELHDTFPDPTNPLSATVDIDLYPGIQHLDGQQALWYVRSRWSSHDFDRNRRQQQVLRAIYRQGMNLGLVSRIPELWSAYQQTVETDMGLSEMAWLGWVASRLDLANVKSRFVGPPYVTPLTAPSGAYILLPVPDAIEPLVAEALQPPAAGRANQPAFRVEVVDGSGRPGMAEVAAERLRWEGFQVVGVSSADQVYANTQLIDLTTTDKGSPLWLLIRLYRLSAERIIRQPTGGSAVEFRVLLGADYNSCIRSGQIEYVPAPTVTPTPSPTPTSEPPPAP